MGLIYCLTSPSGKKYVGLTTQKLNRRLNQHKNDLKKKTAFSNAIRKYGIENFEVEVLCDDIQDQDLLNILECEHIAKLAQDGFVLYNHTNGGGGLVGYTRTEKSKLAISKSVKDRWQSQEYREKASKSMKWTEDRYEVFSKKMKEKWQDENYRKKVYNARIITNATEEYKRKKSEAARGENNPFAKLTNVVVLEIKRLVDSGLSNSTTAKKLNLPVWHVARIMRGESWSHLTGIEKRGKPSDKSVQPDAKD